MALIPCLLGEFQRNDALIVSNAYRDLKNPALFSGVPIVVDTRVVILRKTAGRVAA